MAEGAGCGGGGAGGTTGGETETGEAAEDVPFEAFFAAAEAAFCEWQVGCGEYGAEARCGEANHMEVQLSIARLAGVGYEEAVPIDYVRAAMAAGTVAYDGAKAGACLEFVRARGCDMRTVWTEETLAQQAACAQVFTGSIGRNGPCLTAFECAEPSACGFDPACTATDMCCVGGCRTLAVGSAVGESCVGQGLCEEDAYCDFGVSPAVCRAALKLGEACPYGGCGGGNFCDYNDGDGSFTCRAPRPEGAQCDSDEGCEAPLRCGYDKNYMSSCYRPRDTGEACDPEVYYWQCMRLGDRCDPETRTCASLPGKGEPCPGGECQGDLFCSSFAGGRCVPVADPGEGCGYAVNEEDYVPCSGDSECQGEGPQKCVAPRGEVSCPIPGEPG